jgi:thiol-disulfide isomerase/thioredoxin
LKSLLSISIEELIDCKSFDVGFFTLVPHTLFLFPLVIFLIIYKTKLCFFLRNSFKFLVYLTSLLLFITNHSLSQPIKDLPFKNIVVHEVPKEIIGEEFIDFSGKKLKFNKFDHQINLINFWSTWCVPCKEEMPSIDKLVDVVGKDKIKIFAINLEKINKKKTDKFFTELKIKNFSTYYDPEYVLANKIGLRGLPTTLIVDRNGKEIARVIGSINFADEKFIIWLKNL